MCVCWGVVIQLSCRVAVPDYSVLLVQTLGGRADDLSTWASAPCVEALDCVPTSRRELHPASAIRGIWGVSSPMEHLSLCISVSLPLKQKLNKNIRRKIAQNLDCETACEFGNLFCPLMIHLEIPVSMDFFENALESGICVNQDAIF